MKRKKHQKTSTMKLMYKNGTPMRKYKSQILEELYKPAFSINNGLFYCDIIKTKDAIFSRRNGHRGYRMFGYSILFYFK
jgi:hypothetical protein